MKEVKFKSNNLNLAGHLYYPQGFSSVNSPIAAIVVSHPGTGVKEQAAGLYAKNLADRGFITLTFDAAYQGESEGLPRGLEDPAQRVEDIKAAVSYLQTLKEVDPKNIGVLGICASGGYAITAAATDHRIKATATVSAIDIGRQFRNGGDGKQDPAIIQGMLDAAANDRVEVAKGKDHGVFPIFPETEEQAKSMGQHVYEGWEYYCTERAQKPSSAKCFTWNSVERIAAFDAFMFADFIAPRPLLMIAGTEAETLWMTNLAMETAKEPKELFLIDGATHVALYDKEEFIQPAVGKLDDFFNSNLA